MVTKELVGGVILVLCVVGWVFLGGRNIVTAVLFAPVALYTLREGERKFRRGRADPPR